MALNKCGCTLRNNINVDITGQRNSMCHLHICKICRSLIYTLRNGTHSEYWYHYPIEHFNRHLLALLEQTQHTYSEHSFVFYITFCPIVSLKIKYNHNINGKVYCSRWLSVTDIHFIQLYRLKLGRIKQYKWKSVLQ